MIIIIIIIVVLCCYISSESVICYIVIAVLNNKNMEAELLETTFRLPFYGSHKFCCICGSTAPRDGLVRINRSTRFKFLVQHHMIIPASGGLRICSNHNRRGGKLSLAQCNFGESRLQVKLIHHKRKRAKNTPARTTSYRPTRVSDIISALEDICFGANDSNSVNETETENFEHEIEVVQPPISWARFKDDPIALRSLFNAPSAGHIETIVDSLHSELSLHGDDSESANENEDTAVLYIIIIFANYESC